MLTAALLLATSLQAQTPPPPPPADAAAERAAAAAESAAKAAQSAADASARMAAAAERLAQAVERTSGTAAPAATAEKKEEKKEEKKDEKKMNVWAGTASLGLIALSGNASTITVSALAAAERRTEHWIFSSKAFGTYGRSRPPESTGEDLPSQVVALAAGLQLRGDRRFTQIVSGYLLGGGETDHVKSIEGRGFGEGGLGLLWWDEKRPDGSLSTLRTDLAFRYTHEWRFQYFPTRMDLPDVDLGGPRLGLAFRYGLNKDIIFSEDAEVLPSVLEGSRVLFNSRSQLISKLTEALAVSAGFLVQYDSAPPPGKRTTDTTLSFSFDVGF